MAGRDFSAHLRSSSEPFNMSVPLVIDGGLGAELTVTADFSTNAKDVPGFTCAFTGGAVQREDYPLAVIGVALTSVGTLEYEDPALLVPLQAFDSEDAAIQHAHAAVRDLDETAMLGLLREAYGWLFAGR